MTKGPIGTKGPRVTTNVLLPGRYLVLLPNSEQSGVSRKIENKEERLHVSKKSCANRVNIPDGMGVIIRTAGQNQRKGYFLRDLKILLDTWEEITGRVQSQSPGSCVFEEPDLIERTARDFLTEDIERIVIDNASETERVKELIGRISSAPSRRFTGTLLPSRFSTGSALPGSLRPRTCGKFRQAVATSSLTKPRHSSRSTSTPAAIGIRTTTKRNRTKLCCG